MAHQTENSVDTKLTSEELEKLASLLKHPKISALIDEIEKENNQKE